MLEEHNCLVCIVVNGEIFESHAVTLTLIRQWPIVELVRAISMFKFQVDSPIIFEINLSYTQTKRHTDRRTQTHTSTVYFHVETESSNCRSMIVLTQYLLHIKYKTHFHTNHSTIFSYSVVKNTSFLSKKE